MGQAETKPLMTLSEVADYLKIAERTVLRLVHNGTLPGTKVGNQWRFFKSIIDEWLLANMGNSQQIVPGNEENGSLSGLFNARYVLLGLKPGPKKDIFRQLINPLLEDKFIGSPSLLIQKLLYRENISSTGIGHGVAFPHIRNPRENPIGVPPVIAGICMQGADFSALDHNPVKLFFLLCSNKESVHLFIMSRLGHFLMDESFRTALIKSPSADEFVRLIDEKENLK